MSHSQATIALGLLLSAASAGATPLPPRADPPPQASAILIPEDEPGAAGLEARAERQREESLPRLVVPHEFGFSDAIEASGIGFVHRIVEDAGKNYKPVHYDHGNGVAAADVDGDGWTDLYFVNQLGRNELWRNLGDGRFEDWTERSGVALHDRIGVSASFADLDNDGDPDLYVTTVMTGNVLFENRGDGVFVDRTVASGLDYVGHSSSAVFFDHDRDGLLDILVTNVGVFTSVRRTREGSFEGLTDAFRGHLHPWRKERTRLYRNRGALSFADVTESVGLTDDGWNGDALTVDFDGDGDLDLYLLNMQGDDHYWENRDGRFVEATAEHFPRTPWGTMGVASIDLENDGRLDLLLTDMHSDMSVRIPPRRETLKSVMFWDEEMLQGGSNNIFGNAAYRNLGNGRFEEVSDGIGFENYWPWGLSVGDLNADGFEDVFVTASMNYPLEYHPNHLYLNNAGRGLVAAEFLLGVEPRLDGRMHVPWFELDCDGEDAEHEHCAERHGRLVVNGALGSRSSVILDLDGDADLDLVIGEFGARPQVMISDLAQRSSVSRLALRLEGRESNRDGIGALVRVETDRGTQLRRHDGKSGYLSQSSIPLYFGLGEASVRSIEVLWPSGRRQLVPVPGDLGPPLRVVEPVGLPEPPPAGQRG